MLHVLGLGDNVARAFEAVQQDDPPQVVVFVLENPGDELHEFPLDLSALEGLVAGADTPVPGHQPPRGMPTAQHLRPTHC
jgi:hypothetical protein